MLVGGANPLGVGILSMVLASVFNLVVSDVSLYMYVYIYTECTECRLPLSSLQ